MNSKTPRPFRNREQAGRMLAERGAIASGGVRVLNDEVVRVLNLSNDAIERVAQVEQRELERRERLYRDNRPFPDLQDQVAILIDDGLATGSTMRAAVQEVRQHRPGKIVVAVPAAAAETCDEFRNESTRSSA